MVTSRINLDDVVDKGFEELITNKGNHIKILVTSWNVSTWCQLLLDQGCI